MGYQKGDFSNRVEIICKCGIAFRVKKSKAEKSKYCSQACGYKYRIAPKTRKKYVIKNPAKKRGPNSNHYLYKGEQAGYVSLHNWVKRHKVDPKKCEHCGAIEIKLQWSNKSHLYKRDLDDWIRLCIPCHKKHDLDENGNKRIDTAKFGIAGKDRKNGKLTNQQIIEIFNSILPQPELAVKYGVGKNYISRIQNRVRAARITKNLEKPFRG
jgi:hypothetical protein